MDRRVTGRLKRQQLRDTLGQWDSRDNLCGAAKSAHRGDKADERRWLRGARYDSMSGFEGRLTMLLGMTELSFTRVHIDSLKYVHVKN